jgi:hypothetical protein
MRTIPSFKSLIMRLSISFSLFDLFYFQHDWHDHPPATRAYARIPARTGAPVRARALGFNIIVLIMHRLRNLLSRITSKSDKMSLWVFLHARCVQLVAIRLFPLRIGDPDRLPARLYCLIL